MTVTATPIFTQSPLCGIATFVTPTAITSGANITGTTGLTALIPTSTNGVRVDAISYEAAGTTAAALVYIWIYNGTTSYLFDTLIIPAVTPSTTVVNATATNYYNGANQKVLYLPPTFAVYVSTTISQNGTVFGFNGAY